METQGNNVPEARAKSAVVEIDSKSKGGSYDPFMKQAHNKLHI